MANFNRQTDNRKAKKRRRRREGVCVAIVKREHDTTACPGLAQPGDAFAGRDAPKAEAAQAPKLPLEFLWADIQQLEACALGRRCHVVIAQNGKRGHDA